MQHIVNKLESANGLKDVKLGFRFRFSIIAADNYADLQCHR